jgi:endogenous inhibitor of DNA gyrase (YacG/DUF329 family)
MIKVRCPICQRWMEGQGPVEWPQFPFCSQRCRLVDLGRWLKEDYRLPSDELFEEAPPDAGGTNYPP